MDKINSLLKVYGCDKSFTPDEIATQRAKIIKAWGETELRHGVFVNLDEEIVASLMICPDHMLAESCYYYMRG